MNYSRIMELAETLREMEKDAPSAFTTVPNLNSEIEPGDHQQQGGPLNLYQWTAAIYGNPEDLNKGRNSQIARKALDLNHHLADKLFFHRHTQNLTAGDAAIMLMHLALTGEVETNIVKLHLIDERFQHLDIENIHFMADFFEQELSTNPSLYNQKFWGEGMFNDLEQYNETRKNFNCGTPACVAGWTTLLLGHPEPLGIGRKEYSIAGEEINDIANELLGIHNDAHCDLFAGNDYDSKPEAVAQTLRHLADSGTVVWQFPEDFPEGMTRERAER